MGTKTGAFEEEEEEEEKKRRKREGTKMNRYLPSKERMAAMHETARNGEAQQALADKCQRTKEREP
jgi:hypothetical protein